MSAETITKYLSHFAESEAQSFSRLPALGSTRVVVLPLFEESEQMEDLLAHHEKLAASSQERVLAIFVLNAKENIVNDERDKAIAFYESFRPTARLASSNFIWSELSPHLSLLLVDRVSPGRGFAEKQGVGLARKIGCDSALMLIAEKKICSPWIWTTDADARPQADYFHPPSQPPSTSALVYRYRHEGVGILSRAHDLYEISLRYYEEGLRFAGSRYAFQTVGSTLAIHPLAYAAVRGFPKREAGEDFYLLNKLAKVGNVLTLNNEPVDLRARVSSRVPFGTGAAVKKLLAKEPLSLSLYHPQIFCELKTLLEQAEAVCKGERQPFPVWPALDEALKTALSTRKTPEQRKRHFHATFDAFQTLKFVHWMRDNRFASLDWREALNKAEFFEENNFGEDPTCVLEWLRQRELNSPLARVVGSEA